VVEDSPMQLEVQGNDEHTTRVLRR